MATFGERLRELREEYEVRQEPLATYLGIDRSTISKWESANGSEPDVAMLRKIASFFGVTVDFLVGHGEGYKPPFVRKRARPEDVSRRLQYLRKQKGVSLEQFANAIGISVGALIDLERGVDLPDHVAVATIASYCDVTPGYLYGEDDVSNNELPEGVAEGWRDQDVKEVMEDYRELPPEVREEVREYLAFVRSRLKLREEKNRDKPK